MTKLYKVSTDFSKREIIARSKREAVMFFKQQLKNFISDTDKIAIK